MWNEQKIERYLQNRLSAELGEDVGKNYYADYLTARKYLVEEVLPSIKATEPSLTDHGAPHIANVLKNAWYLLTYHTDDEKEKYKIIKKLTAHDLYVLCLSILFHDVGNINGRENHNKKISDIYKAVRGDVAKYRTERSLILKAAEAHCGKTKSGSRDTLKEIDNNPHTLFGDAINFLDIVSILRFADELAEGPQRTSDYLLKTDKISLDSMLYHKYANITNIFIDRGTERIVLQYFIDIKNENADTLKELLSFTYERIIKLDEERRYAKFYSKMLEPFKKTEVTFSFTNDGEPIDVNIGKIILPDVCIIPGEKTPCGSELTAKFGELNIDVIINQLDLK